jgi:preprotein translocase subunit SecY
MPTSLLQSVLNAFRLPDLRRKLLFTLAILVIYRLVAHIPIPGVNRAALDALFQQYQLLGMFNLLSGGALSTASIVAMGVYPYVTASIVLNLLQPIIPQLRELAKEGEQGRQKINLYTHILTVPMALLQAIGTSLILARTTTSSGAVLTNFGFSPELLLPSLTTIITLTAGTMFAMWLGELITQEGIGQGISVIIFGGIVAQIPQRVGQLVSNGDYAGVIWFTAIGLLTVAAIVVITEGTRRVPVHYGKRVRGSRVYGGQTSHIPMKVNQAGMIPLIFAQSILILPGVVAQYFAVSENQTIAYWATVIATTFSTAHWFYWIMYFLMVIGFTYMYTDIMFKQQNWAETLQKQGAFIPGMRPGKVTESYLNSVLGRITFAGAVFLGLVALLPWFMSDVTETTTMIVSSTGLLIVVGVVLDTMKQLEAQLLMRQYEGFIK